MCLGFARETTPRYITYQFNGRLGDCLLSLSHAQWFAYKRELEVLFFPFAYSEKFKLYDILKKDQLLIKSKKLEGMQKIASIEESIKKKKSFIPYFSEFACEKNITTRYLFDVDWDDPIFRSQIRKLISPKVNLDVVHPKKGMLNVAVHIRTTGAFDPKETEEVFPEKFPPLEFYNSPYATF